MIAKNSRKVLIILIILAVIILAGLLFMNWSSPRGFLVDYLKTVSQHKVAAAQGYLIDDAELKELTSQWTEVEKFSYRLVTDESWRTKDETIKPYVKYLASQYKAKVNLGLDGKTKTYSFVLQRKDSTNQWSIFSYLFKGWEIKEISKSN